MVDGLLTGVSNAHFSVVCCGISLPTVLEIFGICVYE